MDLFNFLACGWLYLVLIGVIPIKEIGKTASEFYFPDTSDEEKID